MSRPPPPSSPIPNFSDAGLNFALGRPARSAALASLKANGQGFVILVVGKAVLLELRAWGWAWSIAPARVLDILSWIWTAALVLMALNMLFSVWALRNPRAPLPPRQSPTKSSSPKPSPVQRRLSGLPVSKNRPTLALGPQSRSYAPSPLKTPSRIPNQTLRDSTSTPALFASASAFNASRPQATPPSSASLVLNQLGMSTSTTSSFDSVASSPLAAYGNRRSQLGRPLDSSLLQQLLDSQDGDD